MSYIQFKESSPSVGDMINKHGFLVIDKDRGINDGRFRKGFDNFAINIACT